MGRRVLFIGLALAVVGLFVYLGYNSYGARRAGASGEVFSDDPAMLKPKAANKGAATSPDGPLVTVRPQTEQVTAEPPTDGAAAQNGAPATDTINPNPPNGMVFSGTGKYQIYRQGNLTWRVNTETGQSCVIFATDEEWKKPRVYGAGCGRR